MFSGKDLQNEITKDIFNRDKYERSTDSRNQCTQRQTSNH